MKVFSFAPLPVGVLSWIDRGPCVTLIVKWTLALGGSGFTTAAEQEPLCHALPSLFDDPAELHHPGDFVPMKARCDVLLTGSAYSAAPVPAIAARIRVGTFQKRFFALAGEDSAAIPLSSLYLRKERQFDAEPVTVSALSREHPERGRFANVGWGDVAALRTAAIPSTFDWSYFNAAPADQQIDVILPGMPISLEGLSPGGALCRERLPDEWPQLFVAEGSSAALEEVELRCDTLWIDTDRSVCELTFRGTWRPPPGRSSRAGPLPAAVAVTLRGPFERQRPVTVGDLANATVGRALFPEDVADLSGAASARRPIEEIEEIEAEPVESDEASEPPRSVQQLAPRSVQQPVPRTALGRLGAMQLLSARPAEMPALPRDPRASEATATADAPDTDAPRPRRPDTLPLAGGPRRPRTLPFAERAADPQPAPPRVAELVPMGPQAAPDPGARAAPTFGFDATPAPRPRANTIELPPGAADLAVLPFPNAALPAARPPPADSETARQQFLALTTAAPAPPAAAPAPPLVTLGSSPGVELAPLGPVAPPAPLPPPEPPAPEIPVLPLPAPEHPDPPRERQHMRPRPALDPSQNTTASPAGLLPLSVDAAIQQEIWRGQAPLHEILARHGIDDAEWREHLKRRDEMLRAEAEKEAARAQAAQAARDRPPPGKKRRAMKKLRRSA